MSDPVADDDARQRAFQNRVRSLYNIDKTPLDAALRELGAEPLEWPEWERFRDNPPRYLNAADQPTAKAIWRCVEARQRDA